jgi:ferric-dicitrate binding protein FerR (iron transport regulator)
MEGKKLNRELLIDLLIGLQDPKANFEILETKEVIELMQNQWKNPRELDFRVKPDFKSIFDKIIPDTHPENIEKSANTIFLIKEIDDLRQRYATLKYRYWLSLGVAAGIFLLVSLTIATYIQKNQLFKKTYTENIVPNGQRSQVLLPDGTKIFLNSGTILKYDSYFGKRYRDIDLVGEAYFEVAHKEKMPFRIRTSEIEINVLGTKLNVMAYPDEKLIETTVTEGKVSVKELNGNTSLTLNASQKATFHKDSKLLLLNDVNPKPYISWKENLLTFDNENFANVIKKLERWYNVSINVNGKDSLEDRFTLTIKNENLREVLDLISLTTPLEYKIKDNQVDITYK